MPKGKLLHIKQRTRRELEIENLSDELLRLEESRHAQIATDGRNVAGKQAEQMFKEWNASRHGHLCHRGGWPDFFLVNKTTGMPFVVEVKSAGDSLSANQCACLTLFERSGIPAYIWQPRNPSVLMPWRKWFLQSRGFRGGNTARRDD